MRYRTGFPAAGIQVISMNHRIANYRMGNTYSVHRDGWQQLFQCGKLRPESLNNIFSGCFSCLLLPVRGKKSSTSWWLICRYSLALFTDPCRGSLCFWPEKILLRLSKGLSSCTEKAAVNHPCVRCMCSPCDNSLYDNSYLWLASLAAGKPVLYLARPIPPLPPSPYQQSNNINLNCYNII